jgi:hypothetical protein
MSVGAGGEVLNLEEVSSAALEQFAQRVVAAAAGARSRKRMAERMVATLYERCVDAQGEGAVVLARCFQTCAYAQMPMDYQHAADRLMDDVASEPDMRCLALLGTRGKKTTWNDVATSIGHQAIPLPSAEVVGRAPMIARLLSDFGVSPQQLVAPPDSPDFLLHAGLETLNVFHIARSANSPFIPAQEAFVKPFGVRSVLGVGGLLPEGNLFAVLLFLRVSMARSSAEMFESLGVAIRDALAACPAVKTFPRSADIFAL